MKKKVCFITAIVMFVIAAIICDTYEKKSKVNDKSNEEIAYKNIIENNIEQKNIKSNIIGVLKIDKINLEAEIKEGSSNNILKNYIGHIENTSIYDGNIGLAAHNRGNRYSYFSRLNELNNGDIVLYETRFGIKKYIVDNKIEINENDWSKLKNTKDNKITMITCIKNKYNKRLCVQATQKIERMFI